MKGLRVVQREDRISGGACQGHGHRERQGAASQHVNCSFHHDRLAQTSSNLHGSRTN
jgi:hypothetical protein